jgi:phosphate starvation-inducible protein PhoH and related proteins
LAEKIVLIENFDPQELHGVNNTILNKIKLIFPKLKIIARGNEIKAIGEAQEVDDFVSKIEVLIQYIERGKGLSESVLNEILGNQEAGESGNSNHTFANDAHTILHGVNGKPIKARTANQIKLVHEIDKNDIVFALGPAGTGKTYTAVAVAVKALKNKEIKRIILTRPAVEAGESLGFLPGDLKEKIDPYLRPLYDALDDMIPAEKLKQYLENRTIEVAPLAFMRGRTLDNCFVILDEAQNTTDSQIKMFLTRMGPSAKVIITGDMSQVDLPAKQTSGLLKATKNTCQN